MKLASSNLTDDGVLLSAAQTPQKSSAKFGSFGLASKKFPPKSFALVISL
jgi:hypothetical protein